MPGGGATPEQLKALVDYCLEFASLTLRKKGAFLPFGAELRTDGQ